MEIKIYRGTHQIGGCIVAIASGKTRILIDMGSPLTGPGSGSGPVIATGTGFAGLSAMGGLRIEEPYDAVIFTHYHKDHTDLLDCAAENIPMYMGKAARALFLAAQRHKSPDSEMARRIAKIRDYEEKQSFDIGDLKITPIPTDHSAFGSCMLLIEGEGKRILHTGDFRLHGIQGDRVLPALQKLHGTVDVLLIEGTNLSFHHPITVSEYHLSDAAGLLMQRFPYVFVQCGALDFDRLAAFHLASAGRNFYCDPYQMSLLEIVRQNQPEGYDMYGFDRARVWLDSGTEPFCMAVRTGGDFRQIIEPYVKSEPEKTLFIYSMSEGYLKEHMTAVQKLTKGLRYVIKLHTSGHSSIEGLRRAAEAVFPGSVIPIHTEYPERLNLGSQLNSRILRLSDGDTWEL